MVNAAQQATRTRSRHDHTTKEMRARLLDDLTAAWEASLDARIAMSPRSPVSALDELLRARARKVNELARDEVRRATQGLA